MTVEPLDLRLVPNTSVVTAEVDNESVLLNLDTDTYFGLNSLGRDIWTKLEQGLKGEEIVKDLAAEYDVQEEKLRADVRDFLTRLQEHGLVRVEGA